MLTLLGTEARATVEASQYRQFWLWAGVRPQPVLQQADRLYLHQGEIGPLDPVLPRGRWEENRSREGKTCTMCGKLCAMDAHNAISRL